ncbi:MCE family protein [Sporichthya sp.]|uniref:MCE family protein n=1 Tax=Sporichthya sp. TaxID=65475 RepID=UPI0018293C9A|nr:MCE family protein [Sporichthya sp.]MBA3744412.1 MCE family protein [Sporichthya sp.]
MTSAARVATAVLGAVLLATVPAGCGATLTDLPKPGGGVESPNYQITAVFADVLKLPDGARVRVDGVDIGRVTAIETRDFVAQVRMRIPVRIALTDKATAQLRITTPLGEGFIELDPGQGTTTLADGATLPLSATSTTAGVEDLLSAASLLLTGGGLGQLKTVITELNQALDTKRGDTGRLLRSLTSVLNSFNQRSDDIDRTLDALDGLSGTLATRRDTLLAALKDTAPAAQLLADNTHRLTELLAKLQGFATVADRVVRQSREDLVATLREIQPVLDALISISDDVAPTLRQLVRFGTFLDEATPGDYLTGDVNLNDSSLGTPGVTDRQKGGPR